ncbi:MAG: YeeE/YedE family protein, partial [Alphaproteobacteria bacterium]|nr:YeeE/YedE family protein [Alphaproteobacteria bacterium]
MAGAADIETRTAEDTIKRRRWAYGIMAFFALVSIGTFLYNEYYIYLSVYLWFGLVYGMCLQYGRFCFSSAFRDLFAVGVPRMVVGIMIATVLFAFVGAFVTATGLSTFHAAPTSVHAVIAGFIFGVGMVFAGGCASGSLYKTGEGNGNALLVVLSISVTQALFVDVGGWTNKLVPQAWRESALSKGLPESINVGDGWVDQYLAGYVWDQPVTTFAKMSGWSNESFAGAFLGNLLTGVVLPAALLLVVVYIVWSRKSFMRRRDKEGLSVNTFRDHLAGYWAM